MQTTEDAIYEGKWLIALSASGKFLGKLKVKDETGIRLEPVYEIAMVAQNVRGQQQVIRQLMPILLIAFDIGVGFGHETTTIDLSELPESERQSWFEMVRNVRSGMQQMRAQRSGVVLPGR